METDTKKNPKIIHFTGGEYGGKPDKNPFYILYAEYFWKYATRTPFLEQIISDMSSREFFKNNIYSHTIFCAEKLKIRRKLKLAVYCLGSALKSALKKIQSTTIKGKE